MKFVSILTLVSLAVAAPPSDEKQLVITDKFYPETLAIYTAEHDIVDIVVPLNDINFSENTEKSENIDDPKITIFFVEADIKDNGEKEYKGLYVYKNGVAKKVLDNGQCSTYARNRTIYFGASDGIYKYNEKDQTATKYGTVTDNIIRIAVHLQFDIFPDTNSFKLEHVNVYYLTSEYVLYKFDEDEKVATKVEAVKDARDIVFDFDGNMYYYDGSNQFYTYDGERVLKIEGLPARSSKVELIRPLGAVFLPCPAFTVIDGRLYELHAFGKSVMMPVNFQAQPTAFAPDFIYYQYYAYKKKLYMYNFFSLIANRTIEELNEFFEGKEDRVNAFKTMKISHKL